ncbi:hypothetical protein GYMLUDRAFT_65497 [Collybiopsis luxurians FD-317 M1]|uniref:Uncharacterized protein n=1 Tax=Collybiopsis luxurians FD-317 M1 TaxID=944289 RepID=A0A0D0B749_9AGAR|nr:hypothetical protein GYMLUDRAFT_65497 [Collybiopsis luxurians FD-317 M1]
MATAQTSFQEKLNALQLKEEVYLHLTELIGTPNPNPYLKGLRNAAVVAIELFRHHADVAVNNHYIVKTTLDLKTRMSAQKYRPPEYFSLSNLSDSLHEIKASGNLTKDERDKVVAKVISDISQVFQAPAHPKECFGSTSTMLKPVVEIAVAKRKGTSLPKPGPPKKSRSPATVSEKDLADDEPMGPLADATVAAAASPILIDFEDSPMDGNPPAISKPVKDSDKMDTSSSDEVPFIPATKKHDEPNRPAVRFLPLCEVPSMLTSSVFYKKAVLVTQKVTNTAQASAAAELASAINVATDFLAPDGKTNLTYAQPDSAYIVAATAERIHHPASAQLKKDAQDFVSHPDTQSWMKSSKALHERIGHLQATIAGIGYEVNYLLQTQKFHEQELRRLMKELHTVKSK